MITITAIPAKEFQALWPDIRKKMLQRLERFEDKESKATYKAIAKTPEACLCAPEAIPKFLKAFSFRDFPIILGEHLLVSETGINLCADTLAQSLWNITPNTQSFNVYNNG